jgi:hypothetical protein
MERLCVPLIPLENLPMAKRSRPAELIDTFDRLNLTMDSDCRRVLRALVYELHAVPEFERVVGGKEVAVVLAGCVLKGLSRGRRGRSAVRGLPAPSMN